MTPFEPQTDTWFSPLRLWQVAYPITCIWGTGGGIPQEHVQAMSLWEVNQNRSPIRSIFNALGEWTGERRLWLVRAGHAAGTRHVGTHVPTTAMARPPSHFVEEETEAQKAQGHS